MPKYLVEASYTREGVAGYLANGGSSRRDAVSNTVAGLGGQLQCFYFGFGDRDAFVIVDVADDGGGRGGDDRQRVGRRRCEDNRAVDAGAGRRGGQAFGRLSRAGELIAGSARRSA